MTKKILTAISVLAVIAIASACLVACVPQSAEKASDALEEKGYTLIIDCDEDDLDADEKDDGLTGLVVARKGALLKGEYIIAMWFSTADEAKEYYDQAVELIAKYVDEDEEEIKESLFTAGTCIYFGSTEDAVKDFKS